MQSPQESRLPSPHVALAKWGLTDFFNFLTLYTLSYHVKSHHPLDIHYHHAKIKAYYNYGNAKIMNPPTYITRELETSIQKYLPLPEILAIVGPRRSGKTTFLRHLATSLESCAYLSFENQTLLDLFDLHIDTFADRHLKPYSHLILDEFQYSKKGGKHLKYLFDTYPGKKIFISGSSSPELTIKALRFLTGRCLVFTLLPLSFSEFLSTKPVKPTPDELREYASEYMTFGGYPEVVLQPDPEIKQTLLQNIYSLFLRREVKDLTSLSDDYKLKNLLKALSLSIGNLIEYRELSQLSGFDHLSLKRYLNFLHQTYIATPILPFFTNRRTELVKNPKIYFYDLGLRNSLIDNFQPLSLRTDRGALVENLVGIDLLNQGLDLKFWRTKNKAEVDFVWEKNGQLFAAEVKAGPKPSLSPSLLSFITKYSPTHASIVSHTTQPKRQIRSTLVDFPPYWDTKPLF